MTSVYSPTTPTSTTSAAMPEFPKLLRSGSMSQSTMTLDELGSEYGLSTVSSPTNLSRISTKNGSLRNLLRRRSSAARNFSEDFQQLSPSGSWRRQFSSPTAANADVEKTSVFAIPHVDSVTDVAAWVSEVDDDDEDDDDLIIVEPPVVETPTEAAQMDAEEKILPAATIVATEDLVIPELKVDDETKILPQDGEQEEKVVDTVDASDEAEPKVNAKVEEEEKGDAIVAIPEIVGFDEYGLAPIATPYEPPTKPHDFDSAMMFFLRYACGGSNARLATAAVTIAGGIPLVAYLTGTPIYWLNLALVALGLLKYIVSNAVFWYHHMRPAEEDLEPAAKKKSFLTRRVGIEKHNQRENTNVWRPIISEEESKTRAFAPYGISLPRYFFDLFTWSLEYKVHGLTRALCCDFNIGQYASTKATHEDIYYFVINSSMACFIDAKDDGKLKLYETKIAHPDGSTVEIFKLVSELDHQNQRHIRTILQWERAEEGCPARVTTLMDPTEAMVIIGSCGAMKSHVHVHWWSNAVKDLIGKWPLAELSHSLTQGFNSAAQFTSGPMLGRADPEDIRAILLPNAAVEGIPVHSDLGAIAENSVSHRMIKACRHKLKNEVATHLGALEIEAILQATVMHAFDHYCLSAKMPWKCYSHLLDAEFTPFRTTMVRGCTYRTRNLLCRHYKDVDPICAVIYEICHEIDSDFADNALAVGVAA